MIWTRLFTALRKRPDVFFVLLGLAAATLNADVQKRDAGYPVFLSAHSNPNDYAAFATSGWDGNWFVGYNGVWVQKLPPLPGGNYAHAFLGAKLGRMKTLPPVGRPPVFTPVPGEFWMAISSMAAWTKDQRVRLTSTADIPLDGSPEYPLEQVGESEWFWTEVPLRLLTPKGDNYIALWSPTPELLTVSSSPILAAALGGKDEGTWLIPGVNGEPPVQPKNPPGTALSFFKPALALKLIPTDPDGKAPEVRLVSWEAGTANHPQPVLTASVVGDSVERAWVEYLAPGQRHGDVVRPGWKPLGRPLWKAPFVFSLAQDQLPTGKLQLRVAAVDAWERVGASDAFSIEAGAVPTATK